MKTELIHSFSSSSLSGLSRSPSQSTIGQNEGANSPTAGLVGSGLGNSTSKYNYHEDPYYHEEEHTSFCGAWASRAFTKKNALRKFPFIEWMPKYNTQKFVADIIAGLTVGLTLIPQGLAMAEVAALPPQYGLYSAFVGCFIYILVGSTKEITIGPTAIMAIITLTYAKDKPPEYAVLLCFVCGIVTLLMGIFQLDKFAQVATCPKDKGFIVNFISTPVTSGFTSAAALTICSTQIKSLLGLKYKADGFLPVVKGLISHITDIQRNDALVSLVCCVVLLFLRNLQTYGKCIGKRHPVIDKTLWVIATSRSVIVILACTITFAVIGDKGLVKFVGDVVPGLPAFEAPPFSFTRNDTVTHQPHEYSLLTLLRDDMSSVIVLPLLALMEHITIAKAYAGTGRVDASQEMISIGLSNIIGSFFSSMPITGAFSRTAINAASGVQSPMGGLLTGVLVLLSLQFLTPYFYFIPKAALASVICCAVIFTVDFEIIFPMWKSKKMDLLPWFASFSVGLLVSLEIGVLVGFLISLIFILYYAARPGVSVKRGLTTMNGYQFILIDMDRSLVFPSTEFARYVIMKSGTKWGHNSLPVVVDCQFIQFADYTAAQGIRDLFKMFNEKKQELILWRLKPSVVGIITTIMELGGVPFKHCTTEEQLEGMLEAALRDKEDKNDIKITFTVAGDEEDDTSSTNSTIEAESPSNYEAALRDNINKAITLDVVPNTNPMRRTANTGNLGSINYGAEIDTGKE